MLTACKYEPLGGVVEDVAQITGEIILDPASPALLAATQRLIKAVNALPPSAPLLPGQRSVNLGVLVGPTNVAAWYFEQPFWGKMALAGVITAPILLGFLLGRYSKGGE